MGEVMITSTIQDIETILKPFPPIVREALKEKIDAALAEREAQVRAEEREKIAGLVNLLNDKLSHYRARVDYYKRQDYDGYAPDRVLYAAYSDFLDVLQELATYNDNRKG